MIKVYYCFKPFEDTSQVCYHTVDLLIFFYTHRKDRNLLFMTETYHIPFIGHYILIRSYCFHFGSSVSSPVLLLPIQFLCFQSVVYNWYSLDESVCRSGQERYRLPYPMMRAMPRNCSALTSSSPLGHSSHWSVRCSTGLARCW